MSSSPDVRSRRGRLVRFDTTIGAAVLPELTDAPTHRLDLVDEPRVDPTYERGYADGHAAAVQAAIAAATAEARLAAARAESLAASLADEAVALRAQVASQLDAVSQGVAEAALALAEAIVGRSLAGEAPAATAVARAMALVPSGDPVVVRLHPDDVAVVGVLDRPQVTVVADPTVVPGGCLLEAGASTIDGGIAAAVERARTVLTNAEEDVSW